MNQKDLSFGAKGEKFFRNCSAYSFFNGNEKAFDKKTGNYLGITDLRDQKKEGEFCLADGSLIEVKSDSRCYDTGNIMVELSGKNGDIGWYQHCKKNGVKYLCYNLFRDRSRKYPYCTVLFDFDRFVSYVDNMITEKCLLTKHDDDGTSNRLLKVNLNDAIHHCDPLISQTYTLGTAKLQVTPSFVEKMNHFLSSVLGENNYRWNPEDCIVQSVFRSSDLQDQ